MGAPEAWFGPSHLWNNHTPGFAQPQDDSAMMDDGMMGGDGMMQDMDGMMEDMDAGAQEFLGK